MKDRFFKTVLGVMLILILLCVIQLARIEFGYEIANFLDARKIITLDPRLVARQYMLALKKKDYKIAYSYLVSGSQEKFSLSDFIALDERSKTEMDEKNTWIEGIYVGMQIYQDPGSWGFLMVKADGKWRIVMSGGSPSFPYSFDCNSCCCLGQHNGNNPK